jgi:hypothetical protein
MEVMLLANVRKPTQVHCDQTLTFIVFRFGGDRRLSSCWIVPPSSLAEDVIFAWFSRLGLAGCTFASVLPGVHDRTPIFTIPSLSRSAISQDVELCYQIYNKLLPSFPEQEQEVS